MTNNSFNSDYKHSYKLDNFNLKLLKVAVYEYFWFNHISNKNRKRHICNKVFFKIKK